MAAELSSTALASDPNLAAYYKLEADGTDSGPNSNTLTVTGSPTFLTGRWGNAVAIPDSGKHLDKTSGSVGLPTGTGNLSLVMWIKRTGTLTGGSDGYGALFAGTDGSNFAAITTGSSDNTVRLGTFAAGVSSYGTNLSLELNTWVHVAVVRSNSGATFKTYKNGVLATTDTVTGRNIGSSVRIRIGESYPPGWNCQFDDAAIFSRVLTDNEVSTLGSSPAVASNALFFSQI